jgi:hypothetical protein
MFRVVLFALALAFCPCAYSAAPPPRRTTTHGQKVVAAKEGTLKLAAAIEAYKLNNGNYPAALKDLAAKQPLGGAALLKAEELIDPWGRPYEFDVKGLKNNGDCADVWSRGPEPKDPKEVIGNWHNNVT